MLGRTFAEWKGLGFSLLLLGSGFLIGDIYRANKSEEVQRILSLVSEAADLDHASMLLLMMKRNNPSCARSFVQGSVEQGIDHARITQLKSRSPSGSGDDLDRSVNRAKKALELQDESGVDFSQGCDGAQQRRP